MRMGSKKFQKPASYPDIDAELKVLKDKLDALSMTHETWKEFPMNSRYEVSDYGRLRLLPVLARVTEDSIYITPGKICSLYERTHEKISYMVEVNDTKRVFTSEELVALTYIDKPLLYSHAIHKDGCHLNNHVDNIAWSYCPESSIGNKYRVLCVEECYVYDDILDICIKKSLDPAWLIHAILNYEEYEGKHFKKCDI